MTTNGPGPTASATDPRIGTSLGGYRIDGIAGRGGMGVVYRAWDPSLDRPVALKLLPTELSDDEAFRARFLRETRLAAAIDHPNIIPIYEAGDDGGVLFLAMRLVDGVDLDRRLAAGPLDVPATVALLAPVASALDVAHAGGLVHRDVKPANILVGGSPSGAESVYLTDFGLTKQRDSESGLTRTGSFLGTVEYMAPEQIDGRAVTAATDEYALACTAYRCLTGHLPFERDTPIAMAMAHLKEPPPRVSTFQPDIPIAVDAAIARGMAKDPSERFASCRELVGAVERAGTPPPVTANPPRIGPRSIAAVALVAVLVLAGAFALTGRQAPAVSPSPSVAVAASASVSPTPAPSSTVFPTAAEQKLLDTLPADLQKTCVRGHDQADLTAAGFTGSVANPTSTGIMAGYNEPVLPPPSQASVSCRPAGGPSGAWFLWYAITDYSPADAAMGHIVARFRVPEGDCASPPARAPWRTSSGASGTVMCLTDSGPDGQPWIYWTFGSAHVLGVATASAGHYAALHAWWQDVTPFLK